MATDVIDASPLLEMVGPHSVVEMVTRHITINQGTNAADVAFTPGGGISATNVQAAILELVTDIGIGYVTLGTTQTITGKKMLQQPLAFDYYTGVAGVPHIEMGDGTSGIGMSASNVMRFIFSGTARVTLTTSSATFTERLSLPQATVSTPSIYGTGDTNTGIYFLDTADKMAIAVGGVLAGSFTTAGNSLFATSATAVPLIAKGAASQTANLQQWQNSAGTITSFVDELGFLRIGPTSVGGMLGILSYGNTTRLMVLRAAASQSANIIEIQDSTSTVLSRFKSDGDLSIDNAAGSAVLAWNILDFSRASTNYISASNPAGLLAFRTGGAINRMLISSTGRVVIADSATDPGSTVRLKVQSSGGTERVMVLQGGASQTADLQQWQSSAGIVLAGVESAGIAWFGSATSPGGSLGVTPTNAGNVGLRVRGFASQTANLQEWQDSSAAVAAAVSVSGSFRGAYLENVAQTNAYLATNASGGAISIVNRTSVANVPFTVRGMASQSGNLTEWQQNDAAIFTAIGPQGHVGIRANPSATNSLLVGNASGVGNVPMIVRGQASQTGDLQQWQNSAGTVLLSVPAAGGLKIENHTFTQFDSSYLNLDTGLRTVAKTAATAALIARGAAAQTGDLFQAQNSVGTAVMQVTSDGTTVATRFGSAGAERSYFGGASLSGVILTVNANTASWIPLVAKGVTSQTANLQEWRSSTDVVYGKVTSAGGVNFDAGANYSNSIGSSSGVTNYRLYIPASIATVTPLMLRGAASQTANLAEWQDSTGTILSRVSSVGVLYAPFFQATGSASYFGWAGSPTTKLEPNAPASTALVVRGYSSQTGNLTEWQDSASIVLTRMDAYGRLGIRTGILNNSVLSVTPDTAASLGVVIRGMASQTGDLHQWQDSAGTVLASVSSAGIIKALDPTGTGGHAFGGASGGSTEVTIDTRFASWVGLNIRGRASQTANLQEWQNSAGTVQSRIFSSGGFQTLTNNNTFGLLSGLGSTLGAVATSASVVPLIARGFASQTADLLQFQNSAGTVLSFIDAAGGASFPYAVISGSLFGNDIDFVSTGRGPILVAPLGGRWRVGVDDNGILTTVGV
jgi:hypothetical protein